VGDRRFPSWMGVGIAAVLLLAAGAHGVYFVDASRSWHVGTKVSPGPDRALWGFHIAIALVAVYIGTVISLGRAVLLRILAFTAGLLAACSVSEHGFGADAQWLAGR
jgi:hypothetical protein